MARKINYEIFGALNVLFAAGKVQDKKRRKMRRDLIAGRIDKTEFEKKSQAMYRAFDRRYHQIYRALA